MRCRVTGENAVSRQQVVVEFEDHLTAPLVNSTLQGSQLTICILAGIPLLKLLQKRFGSEARLVQKALVQLSVNCGKWIVTRPPSTRFGRPLGATILSLLGFTTFEHGRIGVGCGWPRRHA